ncbi:MAG TPA: hypothetical protein VKB80_04390 [Kofleriaceae bacterium]|nr:hypothetical protein [Kofleriaceae bacterium]
MGSDEAEHDAVPPGQVIAGDDGLWTRVSKPPYHASEEPLSRRVVEFEPDSVGDITLVAGLRWRERSAGAVNPQLRVGLISAAGESTLLQVFEAGGGLRARADLEMTDALQVGAWYRLMVTISDSPGRPMQVRIADQRGVEVWRSCAGASGSCPSMAIDPDLLDTLRVSVTVDDVQGGAGYVELRDISLVRHP